MKMRTWAGAALTALLLAGCGGSAVEPDVAGPQLDYAPYLPDEYGTDPDTTFTGYFGSGHVDPKPKPDSATAPG